MEDGDDEKTLLTTVAVIAIGIGGGLMYLYSAFPNIDSPTAITVEGTEQQVARGRYLAEHATVCIDCHSTRDWSKFSGPIKPGLYG